LIDFILNNISPLSEKKSKLNEIPRYSKSYENFSPVECKNLLYKLDPDIDELYFINQSDYEGEYDSFKTEIPDGGRYVTFIYNQNGTFKSCNTLRFFIKNLKENKLKFEKYFNCGVENCKNYTFNNGSLVYVYDDIGEYSSLKYILIQSGKENYIKPSIIFQVFYENKKNETYITEDMKKFIQFKIKAAEDGFGCGSD